jgi:hypothetical protein
MGNLLFKIQVHALYRRNNSTTIHCGERAQGHRKRTAGHDKALNSQPRELARLVLLIRGKVLFVPGQTILI